MRELVEGYFAGVNAEDWGGLSAVLHPDVEIHTTGAQPALGREEALAHFRAVLGPFTSHVDTVTRWVETPGVIVCEIAFRGTLADGREVAFDAVDVFDVGAAGITRVGTWYDTRSVARQVRG